MTPAVVLDASAGVEVVLWTEQGSRLASHVLAAAEIVVPDHFHLECASALGASNSAEVSPTEAQTALEQLLDLRVRHVSMAPLVREAWGMRHNVTVGDALRSGCLAPLVSNHDPCVSFSSPIGWVLPVADNAHARAYQLGGQPEGPLAVEQETVMRIPRCHAFGAQACEW